MKHAPTTPRGPREPAPSRKLLSAAALFGFALTRTGEPDLPPAADPRRAAATLAARLDAALKPGEVALITGPSGSGKSALLARLAARLAGRVVVASTARPARSRRPVIDLLDLPLRETLGVLSAAGLAEARLLGLKPAALSDGQRFRLALALAMARAGVRRPSGKAAVTLVCDEFGSTLDRAAAQSVCVTLARWTSRTPGLRVVVATAHADVEAWLRPRIVARTSLAGPPAFIRRPARQPAA